VAGFYVSDGSGSLCYYSVLLGDCQLIKEPPLRFNHLLLYRRNRENVEKLNAFSLSSKHTCLTEMSTRCISWSKGGRCVRLTTLPPSCAVVMKSGTLNYLERSGPLQACNGTVLPFIKHTCL
jgi:hypothetical protein